MPNIPEFKYRYCMFCIAMATMETHVYSSQFFT